MRRVLVRLLVGTAAVVGLIWVPVRAQSDAKPPAFEVASVKPNKSGMDEMVGGLSERGGRFTVINTPLREIIRVAYRLQPYQILGGPSWIDSERFNIAAKAADDASEQEMWLMVRPLLAERFKLAVHSETRQLPIYALVVAGSNAQLGPHLRRSDADCAAKATGWPLIPFSLRSLYPHGVCLGSVRASPGHMTARTQSMTWLAFSLSQAAGRPVADRTGLAGYFDYQLEWTPDQLAPRPPGAPDLPPVDPNRSSIFTALQEQLGLKLESTTGPVDVLVIDHVEPPTPD